MHIYFNFIGYNVYLGYEGLTLIQKKKDLLKNHLWRIQLEKIETVLYLINNILGFYM